MLLNQVCSMHFLAGFVFPCSLHACSRANTGLRPHSRAHTRAHALWCVAPTPKKRTIMHAGSRGFSGPLISPLQAGSTGESTRSLAATSVSNMLEQPRTTRGPVRISPTLSGPSRSSVSTPGNLASSGNLSPAAGSAPNTRIPLARAGSSYSARAQRAWPYTIHEGGAHTSDAAAPTPHAPPPSLMPPTAFATSATQRTASSTSQRHSTSPHFSSSDSNAGAAAIMSHSQGGKASVGGATTEHELLSSSGASVGAVNSPSPQPAPSKPPHAGSSAAPREQQGSGAAPPCHTLPQEQQQHCTLPQEEQEQQHLGSGVTPPCRALPQKQQEQQHQPGHPQQPLHAPQQPSAQQQQQLKQQNVEGHPVASSSGGSSTRPANLFKLMKSRLSSLTQWPPLAKQ